VGKSHPRNQTAAAASVSTVCVTDGELVTQARAGNQAAFGELVDRHRTAVYRAARAALGSHADAEDAAQDAFLVAFRRLDTFRGEASFKTWLLTIAWHQAINRRRSVTRLLRRIVEPAVNEEGDVLEAQFAATGPTPEQAALERQSRRAIRAEIVRLPRKLRDALLLAQSGEHTYDEIGAMLGVAVGTIKWRVSEARRVVKQRLREQGYESLTRSQRRMREGEINGRG
jgi:RNA polymerase sigma-70 factor, ECF subfamily